MGIQTVPAVVVNGEPIVSGFYDARRLATALNLGPEAWGLPPPRPPERREQFMADLDWVADATGETARRVPTPRLDDRPEGEFWSIRELAYHSFAFNNRVRRAIAFDEPMTWDALNAYIDECQAFSTADAIADAGLALHAEFKAWFASRDDTVWTDTLETHSGEQSAEDILFFALGHMAFHLVQLYRYLDLVGVQGFPRLSEARLLDLDEPTPIGSGTDLVDGRPDEC
jgi:uncharacterized damage-inducible protein DinB